MTTTRTTRRFIRAVLALGLASATSVPSSVLAADEKPLVTAAVQITTNPFPVRAHTSPQIARNPKSGELVVAEADVRGTRQCAVHISGDRGRSWFAGGNPMVEPFTDCTIGAEWGTYFNLFFDDDGTLFMPFAANDPKVFASTQATGGNDRKFVPRNLYLARSTDGGRTFNTTTVHNAPGGNPATSYAYGIAGAVDPDNQSRVYVTWAQGDFLDPENKTKAVIASSSDGGRSFGPPVDMTDRRGSEQAWVTVGRDGTLHAAWWSLAFDAGKNIFERGPEDDPLPLIYGRSSDQGKSWVLRDIDPGNQEYTRHPVIVADPSSDWVYVLWFGNGEPRNLPLKFDDKDHADIFLRASDDGGRTWGPRRAVNDDAGKGVNHAHPGMSMAPNGRLDIAWYDNRHSPRPAVNVGDDTGMQDVYYASSDDHGRTFGPSIRVTDRSIDRSIGVWSNNIGSAAPIGIVSTNATVHVAWQDSRNGSPLTQAEDVYSSSVRLAGSATAERDSDGSDVPRWLFIAAGFLLGLGLATAMAAVYRRRADAPGRSP